MATTAGRQNSAANRIAKLGPAPRSLLEALASEEAAHWQAAVAAELEHLKNRGVWEPTIIAKGVRPIGSRWVFQRLPTPSGVKYRARVVAKGSGLDKAEGFGESGEGKAGARVAALRFLLAYANAHDMNFVHIRIEDACLSVPCKPIVMAPPVGVKVRGNAVVLHKTLYGLQSAYAVGMDAVRDALATKGLHPLKTERCLLSAKPFVQGRGWMGPPSIAMTYPGGVIVAGYKAFGDEVLEALRREGLDASHAPNDLIFGLTVRRDGVAGLCLSQPQYVDRVVRRFRGVFLQESPPTPTPELRHEMHALVGCLSWLARTTHSTWMHDVHRLSSAARRKLDVTWEVAWALAYSMLNDLKDPDTRNAVHSLERYRYEPLQLVGSVRDNFAHLVKFTVSYYGIVFDWSLRKPRSNTARARIKTSADAVKHWAQVVHEIRPLLGAFVFAEVDFALSTRSSIDYWLSFGPLRRPSSASGRSPRGRRTGVKNGIRTAALSKLGAARRSEGAAAGQTLWV